MSRTIEYELVEYRDIGMSTYTYFWIDDKRRISSPYFDSDMEAKEWLDEQFRNQREALSSSTERT